MPGHEQQTNVAYNRIRVLLGWLSDEEGVHALNGTRPTAEQAAQSCEQVRAARAAVLARPPFQPRPALVDEPTYVDLLADAAARPSIRAAFAGMSWRPATVDLRAVLSFQKMVNLEGADERIRQAEMSPANLLSICIPSDEAKPPLLIVQDHDKRGFTVSSLNPNLRFWHDPQAVDMPVAPSEEHEPTVMKGFLFIPSIPPSYLQVAHYRGRFFIRDGYHRAAALLHAGIDKVPCIFVQARSWEEVCPNPAGFLTYESGFSEHPAALSDFWDDTVSAEGRQVAVRKVLRVRAEEFAVPR